MIKLKTVKIRVIGACSVQHRYHSINLAHGWKWAMKIYSSFEIDLAIAVDLKSHGIFLTHLVDDDKIEIDTLVKIMIGWEQRGEDNIQFSLVERPMQIDQMHQLDWSGLCMFYKYSPALSSQYCINLQLTNFSTNLPQSIIISTNLQFYKKKQFCQCPLLCKRQCDSIYISVISRIGRLTSSMKPWFLSKSNLIPCLQLKTAWPLLKERPFANICDDYEAILFWNPDDDDSHLKMQVFVN